MMINVKCNAPEAETEKAYKVWNGKVYCWLAKSQMKNVTITWESMTFTTSEWFAGLHPWLVRTDTINL